MTPAEKKELTSFLKRGDKKEICRLAGVHETVMYAWISGRLQTSSIEPYVVQFANRRRKEFYELTGRKASGQLISDEIMIRENLQLKSELNHSHKEIYKYRKLISGKNRICEELFTGLRDYILRAVTDVSHREELLGRIEQFRQDCSFLQQYEKYADVLNSVNPIFYRELEKLDPDLSRQEKQLLSLLKLNLSPYEMSLILAVSEKTIEKKSELLRQRLGLQPGESLSDLINSLG